MNNNIKPNKLVAADQEDTAVKVPATKWHPLKLLWKGAGKEITTVALYSTVAAAFATSCVLEICNGNYFNASIAGLGSTAALYIVKAKWEPLRYKLCLLKIASECKKMKKIVDLLIQLNAPKQKLKNDHPLRKGPA
ncbi:MAG: hypothetical protein PHY92_08745 [Alphaproteobacteria bacterium]|nr:hypothetical protein [Alphaproteobacteria bacterium]